MLANIDTLREICRRCRTHQGLNTTQARWLGEALTAFLEHRSPSLDDAMGLSYPRGGVPWWMEEAIRKRNAALRNLAHSVFADLGPSAQAERVWILSNRYAASSWRHDRRRVDLPVIYANTPKQYLWEAFASGAAMPIGKRQLRSVLADSGAERLPAAGQGEQPCGARTASSLPSRKTAKRPDGDAARWRRGAIRMRAVRSDRTSRDSR